MSVPGKNESKQEQAALALAVGSTVEQAATKAKVSTKTVHRWKELPAFQQRIADLRAEFTERTMARLVGSQVVAASVLHELLHAKSDPVRLRAAKAILDLSYRVREEGQLAAEVAELRQMVLQLTSEKLGPRPARKGTA